MTLKLDHWVSFKQEPNVWDVIKHDLRVTLDRWPVSIAISSYYHRCRIGCPDCGGLYSCYFGWELHYREEKGYRYWGNYLV